MKRTKSSVHWCILKSLLRLLILSEHLIKFLLLYLAAAAAAVHAIFDMLESIKPGTSPLVGLPSLAASSVLFQQD